MSEADAKRLDWDIERDVFSMEEDFVFTREMLAHDLAPWNEPKTRSKSAVRFFIVSSKKTVNRTLNSRLQDVHVLNQFPDIRVMNQDAL